VPAPVVLGGTRPGDDLTGTRQDGLAEDAVAGRPLKVADIRAAYGARLSSTGVDEAIPDAPICIHPRLYQLPWDGDQLHRLHGARVSDDPLIGVSALQAGGLQNLFHHKWRHGLIGTGVEQIQDL